MRILHGRVVSCSKCMAPWTLPMPDGYSITVRTVKGLQWAYMHTPDCPRKFPKVEIPDE